jgi:hypothetical protein
VRLQNGRARGIWMRKEQKRGNEAENERAHNYPKPRAKLPGLLHGKSTLIVQLVSMPRLSVRRIAGHRWGAGQQFP